MQGQWCGVLSRVTSIKAFIPEWTESGGGCSTKSPACLPKAIKTHHEFKAPECWGPRCLSPKTLDYLSHKVKPLSALSLPAALRLRKPFWCLSLHVFIHKMWCSGIVIFQGPGLDQIRCRERGIWEQIIWIIKHTFPLPLSTSQGPPPCGLSPRHQHQQGLRSLATSQAEIVLALSDIASPYLCNLPAPSSAFGNESSA